MGHEWNEVAAHPDGTRGRPAQRQVWPSALAKAQISPDPVFGLGMWPLCPVMSG